MQKCTRAQSLLAQIENIKRLSLLMNLRTIASKIGINKSIAYSSGARVIQGIAGVGSMFFISTFLTGIEQGFYFTFGSILALQVFFELGLSGIMTQYVAHEVSYLTLDCDGVYQGEDKYKSRLSYLVHFCVKWYAVISLLVLVFLIVVGFLYFQKYGSEQAVDLDWRTPWMLICIATAVQLFISPITAIITGLGFVKETSKISFFQQLIVPLCTWIGLACGFKLYVTGIGYIISVSIWFIFVRRMNLICIIRNLWYTIISEKVDYMKELFPYQWKIATSWISGYFIFQLFNPVLFATEGAVVAGQMGMTLQALNAINAFSMSWINTKIPLFSGMIAQKQYGQLDEIFNKTVKQMSFVCLLLLAAFFLLIVVLHVTDYTIGDTVLADRFLDYFPMLLMMLPIFLGQYISSWATYLRCHKEEPYLINSVVAGVLCLLSTFFLGKKFGLYGVTIGYCCIRILLFPWAYSIYKRKRIEWHG